MPYSSSLTDAEWEILAPLLPEILPQKKRTRPCDWTKRQILDGICYQHQNGCKWEDLPCILTTLLDSLLGFIAVADGGCDRYAHADVTPTSPSTGKKSGSGLG